MTRTLAAAVGMILAAAGGSTSVSAREPITVSVWPAVTTARAAARLKIQVDRDDENRALIWVVDGPSYYRSSTQQIDGADAPRLWFVVVKDLPAGEFDVRAVVRRRNNSEVVALTKIVVLPRAGRENSHDF